MTVAFDAIIALGSNMGDKLAYLDQAVTRLESHPDIHVVGRSKLYRTAAWGEENQDWFLNACVSVTTDLAPVALLNVCQSIENDLGRVRQRRWGPRVIDLDILVFKDVVQDDPKLTLPHPLITERAFVLAPLLDLAPALQLKSRTVRQWLDDIDQSDVSVWEDDALTSGWPLHSNEKPQT